MQLLDLWWHFWSDLPRSEICNFGGAQYVQKISLTDIGLKDFFWEGFLGLILFFLKNSFSFSKIFLFAILLLCIFDLNLINYFLDTEVWYTIQLESGTLFNWSPVHYSTGVRCIIQLRSGTLSDLNLNFTLRTFIGSMLKFIKFLRYYIHPPYTIIVDLFYQA